MLNNELLSIYEKYNQDIDNLRKEDFEYYKKIENEKRAFSQKTEELIIFSATL